MLVNDTFTTIEGEAIKRAKCMMKEQACLLPKISIKFYVTWIQLAPSGKITLGQGTYVGDISLIKDYEAFTISSKGLISTNLTPREQYIAQHTREVSYLTTICQTEASLDLYYAAQ